MSDGDGAGDVSGVWTSIEVPPFRSEMGVDTCT